VWIPIRNRAPASPVLVSAIMARWISCAAATASAADSNTATAPAPWPRRSSRVPRWLGHRGVDDPFGSIHAAGGLFDIGE
jgi:hypothetical protein